MARRTFVALVFAILMAATATLAAAPPAVTLTLTSGDKIRGELVDLGGSGFTIRVRGAEQQIPVSEVAVIDFTGAPFRPAELERVRQGQALAVFHSGDVFEGRLVDIGGTDPLRMTFTTSGGNREVSSSELSRVYLSSWKGMPASVSGSSAAVSRPSQPDLAQGGRGMSVPARQCWTDTGIYVQRNQLVTFVGSGEIQLSDDPSDIAGVAGSKTGRYARNAPIRGTLAGALVGRVGNGHPFGIGDQRQALSMPEDGELFLGINDDTCGDNRGEFKVQINSRRR